jgi:hypothetical protein
MDQYHEDLSGRLDSIEQLFLQQSSQSETSSLGSDTLFDTSEKYTQSPNQFEAIRVIAAPQRNCQGWCPCGCHAQQKRRAMQSGITEKLMGKLFVGYTGLPLFNKPCNFQSCKSRRTPTFNVEYWFPWWFVALNVNMQLRYLPRVGPQFQLTTSRRVPDISPSITCVLKGDMTGLQHLFSQGLASAGDISDSRGFSLMRVRTMSTRDFALRGLTSHLVGTLRENAP